MRLYKLNDTPLEVGMSPFFTGGEVVVFNPTGGDLVIEGSAEGEDDSEDWEELATVPGGDMFEILELPPFIRVSTAATVNLLAG